MGICLPIECNQEDLNDFDDLMLGIANYGIALLPQLGINIDTLVFNNQSMADMKFQGSDIASQEWHERTKKGFWTMTLLVSALAVTSLGLNIYWCFSHLIKTTPKESSKISEYFSIQKCIDKKFGGPADPDY